jgi:hypothetical protein
MSYADRDHPLNEINDGLEKAFAPLHRTFVEAAPLVACALAREMVRLMRPETTNRTKTKTNSPM